MKSKLFSLHPALGRVVGLIRSASGRFEEDLISLSAAQATFFLVTSAVPFLSLLAALTGFLLPENPADLPLPDALTTGSLGTFLRMLTEQISTPPGVPLLSVSAATTLWTASRGISALREGVGRIYKTGSKPTRGALPGRLAAIPTTLAVMAAVTGSSLLLFFGNVLLSCVGGDTLAGRAAEALARSLGLPLLYLLLAAVFALVYAAAGVRSPLFPKRFRGHLPGAFFSAAGWILFSLLYSVYIDHFPRASAVYGTLSAVCLVMLWLYACTLILLTGAEINRMLAEKRSGSGHTEKMP